MAHPNLIFEPHDQVLHLPLLKLDLASTGLLSLIAKVALLELVAKVLNLGSLVDNCQFEVSTLTLKLINQRVAFRDFIFLLSHDLHHEVFLLAVFCVSMRGSRLLVFWGLSTHLDAIYCALVVHNIGVARRVHSLWQTLHAMQTNACITKRAGGIMLVMTVDHLNTLD